MGVGWTTLVAAEMVEATSGIGFMVLSASQLLQTSTVIMGIFIIAAIAYAFDLLMRFLEHRLIPGRAAHRTMKPLLLAQNPTPTYKASRRDRNGADYPRHNYATQRAARRRSKEPVSINCRYVRSREISLAS
jgi:hypothetical protein